MTKRLRIYVDRERVLDVDVHDAVIEINHPREEIRSNPRLASALAGAPPNVLAKLPGEQVAWFYHGSEIEITYKFRATAENGRMTEFRPA